MEKEILLFGGLLLDHYFSVDRWPQRGQDGYVVGQARFVGGCAANMAVTIHNLGGHPHVVSCVGSDRSGETIQRYWREHGLSQRFILETEGETGSCLVFSEPNGERTFLTRKGVELSFPADLAEAVLLCEPAWAGVTGYYLLGRRGRRSFLAWSVFTEEGRAFSLIPVPWQGTLLPHFAREFWRSAMC
ncbi:MAG: carbohydrate kinase family protein [Evtepia gabavorous]